MTDTGELLRRFREREAKRRPAAPTLGLNDDGTRFIRGTEEFGFLHEFDFHIEKSDPFYGARGAVEIDHCTQTGRGIRVELPLASFEHCGLEMVREEIENALRNRRINGCGL